MTDFLQIGQPAQLLLKHLLDRPLTWAPQRRIWYRDTHSFTYREFVARVRQLVELLGRLGVRPGDRVGVMDVDSHRYLELFFAVPIVGAVLHTINVRLTTDQIHYTMEHADDRVLFVHSDFATLAGTLLPQLPGIRNVVLLSDTPGSTSNLDSCAGEYELLLASCSSATEFPELNENQVATLFYTTGTTGEPKGVYFTHRQLVLHTLSVGLVFTAHGRPLTVSTEDVYMPVTPMFHVHGWGFPYVATLLGMKQVYPGRYEPERLLRLIEHHGVTLTHCVPTIVQMLLHHPSSRGVDLSKLKFLVGGSALPEGLAQEAMDRGVKILGAYGMSETCPVISAGHLKPSLEGLEPAAQRNYIVQAGLPLPLVQARIVDPAGTVLPPGKANIGELVLQAPWLTPGYYKNEERSRDLWEGGWLHTGDVGYIDEEGYIRLTDRLKDIIKIGGEWMSSLELENALSQHEAVKEVAVVAKPDPHWGERPHAQVVLRPEHGTEVTVKQLAHFLHHSVESGRLHKRAILTQIQIVPSLPRTSVGKLDKKAIRQQQLGN